MIIQSINNTTYINKQKKAPTFTGKKGFNLGVKTTKTLEALGLISFWPLGEKIFGANSMQQVINGQRLSDWEDKLFRSKKSKSVDLNS